MRYFIAGAFAAALALLGGCGGSSGSSSGGSLSFNPVWEQPAGGGAAAQPDGSGAAFGSDLPDAVKTVRVVFQSDTGQQCCLAIDPSNLPVDPASGLGFLVMSRLPSGPATLSLAGFATDFAPAAEGISDTCAVTPAGAGQSCDSTRVASPSFESAAERVVIVGGTETSAGDIAVFALPFVLSSNPVPGGAVVSPVAITFTVGDAAGGIEAPSVTAEVTEAGSAPRNLALSLQACDDATASPCSGGGELGVRGFHATTSSQTLRLGTAQQRIRARNLAARSVDLSYPFEVRSAPIIATPTPGLPGGVIIARSGSDLGDIARRAAAGSTVIVAPGVYGPIALRPGELRGPITLLADVTGLLTDSSAAEVVINARGESAAVDLDQQTGFTIDGFSIRGARDVGILARGTLGTVIRNCTITGSSGDGLRIEDSDNGVIFDNLIANSAGTGVRALAVNNLLIFNNTIYGSGDGGLVVQASDGVTANNNIVDANVPIGIDVDSSTFGYRGDFNLNTDGYGFTTPIGLNDIDALPLFIAPLLGNFRLQLGLLVSTSPAVNAGDPATPASLVDVLVQRSTQTDGALDVPPVDLGYHYPGPNPPSIPTSAQTF